jgi:hypothetical protein
MLVKQRKLTITGAAMKTPLVLWHVNEITTFLGHWTVEVAGVSHVLVIVYSSETHRKMIAPLFAFLHAQL